MWWLRFKEHKQVLIINERLGAGDVLGKTVLGYHNRAAAVTALKASGMLVKMGKQFKDLELVGRHGHTMAEMEQWDVEEGFAMRHREGWYWMHPISHRVWYKTAAAVETAWKVEEQNAFVRETPAPKKTRGIRVTGPVAHQRRQAAIRKIRTPGQAKMQMVIGFADGKFEVLKHWF